MSTRRRLKTWQPWPRNCRSVGCTQTAKALCRTSGKTCTASSSRPLPTNRRLPLPKKRSCRCLSGVAGRVVGARLVYDAPHNLVWSEGQNHLHRKGACPAANDPADPLFPDGHPVIVPGGMGDSSYVLKGHGSVASLCSAPHGAGRLAARGEGRKGDTGELGRIRVVTSPFAPSKI